MALRSATLDLADAVLANGATLEQAAGSLPLRVGHPGQVVIDDFGNTGQGDIALLSDGRFAVADNGRVLSLFNADGTVAWGPNDAGASSRVTGVAVDEVGGEVFVANETDSRVDVYSLATGVISRNFAVGLAPNHVRYFGGEVYVWAAAAPASNDGLAYTTAGVLSETIVNPAALNSTLYDVWLHGDYIYYAGLQATAPVRMHRTTLAVETIGTVRANSAVLGEAQGGGSRGIWADDSDVFVFNALAFSLYIDRFTPALAATDRIMSPGLREGQHTGWNTNSTSAKHTIAANASKLAYWSHRSTVTVLDRRTATATFSRTFTTAARLKHIIVPGSLGNDWDASFDDRKTRLYYSTNGADFTEFSTGTPLSVALAAGTTLTVRADMTTWAKPTGTPPWIGGDTGEGPTIVWDDLEGVRITVTDPPRITVTVR